MHKEYTVESYDDVISYDLRKEIWDHIQQQEFHAVRKDVPIKTFGRILHYKPADGYKEYMNDAIPGVNNQYMHRCIFGDNEKDLEQHVPIRDLWNRINNYFFNRFEINGDQEKFVDRNSPKARVYVNIQLEETIKRSHAIHRDTINLDEDRNFTLLYMANLEWYPSWMSENVFYADDDTTGDTQQFQNGFGQSRDFNVGYPFKIIPPIPGRIILYDGRALHTTKPVAIWAKEMRYAVVFRIRLK
jgi:hypothetical protein